MAAAASRARVGRCLLYLSPRCRVWFDEQSEGISVKNRSGAFQQACVWTAIPPGPYRLIPLIVVGASSSRSLLACRRLISRWTQDLQAAAEFAITEYIFSLEDHHQSPSICPHGCLPSSASSTRTQHHRTSVKYLTGQVQSSFLCKTTAAATASLTTRPSRAGERRTHPQQHSNPWHKLHCT